MSQPPTILALKQAFISSQTLTLSQPLAPSRAWQTANSESDEGLPEKAVSDALYKLNHILAQHTRRVYAPQATRHIAEQIDSLYWSGVVSSMGEGDEEEEEGVEMGVDLGILSFPFFCLHPLVFVCVSFLSFSVAPSFLRFVW